jgi:hypothetical protein
VSGKGALKLGAAHAQQAQGDDQIAPRDRQFRVGDPIPYVLTKAELADLLGLSSWSIDRFRADHSHPGIKELDGPGHPRFCGRTVKAWLDRGVAEAPVARSFFASRRRV